MSFQGAECLMMKMEFPGSAVVRALCSRCQGPGFDPWSGELKKKIPQDATGAAKKKRRRDGESRDGRGRVGEEKEKKLSFGSCNEKQRGHYLHFQAQKELDLEEKPVII